MASPSSKRKQKMEPISIAELEGDPTMVGFTSLFRIPTTGQPLPQFIPTKEESKPTVVDDPKPSEGSAANPTVGFTSAPTVGDTSSPALGVALPSSASFFSAEDGK